MSDVGNAAASGPQPPAGHQNHNGDGAAAGSAPALGPAPASGVRTPEQRLAALRELRLHSSTWLRALGADDLSSSERKAATEFAFNVLDADATVQPLESLRLGVQSVRKRRTLIAELGGALYDSDSDGHPPAHRAAQLAGSSKRPMADGDDPGPKRARKRRRSRSRSPSRKRRSASKTRKRRKRDSSSDEDSASADSSSSSSDSSSSSSSSDGSDSDSDESEWEAGKVNRTPWNQLQVPDRIAQLVHKGEYVDLWWFTPTAGRMKHDEHKFKVVMGKLSLTATNKLDTPKEFLPDEDLPADEFNTPIPQRKKRFSNRVCLESAGSRGKTTAFTSLLNDLNPIRLHEAGTKTSRDTDVTSNMEIPPSPSSPPFLHSAHEEYFTAACQSSDRGPTLSSDSAAQRGFRQPINQLFNLNDRRYSFLRPQPRNTAHRTTASMSRPSSTNGGSGPRSADAALLKLGKEVNIARALHRIKPSDWAEHLAGKLFGYSFLLSKAEKKDEALKAIEESATVLRSVPDSQPGASKRKAALAGTLYFCSTSLNEVGRHKEALKTAEECLRLFRSLRTAGLHEHKLLLAEALQLYSALLNNAERYEEALKAAEECLPLYRSLHKLGQLTSTKKASLADMLRHYSVQLNRAGRSGDALKAIEESLSLYRPLHESEPTTHKGDLAKALLFYSTELETAHRYDEALKAIEECLPLYRSLHETEPTEFGMGLEVALRHYASLLDETMQHKEAADASEERLAICRSRNDNHSEASKDEVALALYEFSVMLMHADREGDALKAIEECVTTYRAMHEAQPSMDTSSLRQALKRKAFLLGQMGRWRESKIAAHEEFVLDLEADEHGFGLSATFAAMAFHRAMTRS
ncbi:unnamed protein product [Tilletia controversa]|nr:unnamed protein product [Tilletia controversa]